MASTSETGLQLFARLISRPSLVGIDNVLFPDGPHPKEVIEVSGEPSCGKTLLLTQFIVKCISPKEFKNIKIGGLDASVVLLNTDHHFQMYKLISLMENYLQKASNWFTVADIEEVIKNSLARLTIYNVSDSVQLQVTFHSLQDLVSNQPEIGLILLDSVCAFYWQDAMMSGIRKMDLYVKTLLKTLQRTVVDFKGIIMYTRPVHFQSKSDKSEACSSEPGLGFVNRKIVFKLSGQENVFHASVDTSSGGFAKLFKINSAGIQWIE